jgi:hypothetical protein
MAKKLVKKQTGGKTISYTPKAEFSKTNIFGKEKLISPDKFVKKTLDYSKKPNNTLTRTEMGTYTAKPRPNSKRSVSGNFGAPVDITLPKKKGGAIKKYQPGGGTAFQAYLKNVKGSTPSDTLGVNDPRTKAFVFAPSSDNKKNAQAAAFQKTYGDVSGKSWANDSSVNEKDFRVPQTKKTVKDYTKSVKGNTNKAYTDYSNIEYRKKGGSVKKYQTGGITKNKTLYPAGAGLMQKGGAMSDIKTGVKLVDRGVSKGINKVEKKVGQAAKSVVKGAVKVAKTSPYDIYKAGKKVLGFKKGGSMKGKC